MIDEKKIEEAQEEIYEDRFLFNGEDIYFDNDDREEMYYSGQIKEAIKLGAHWAINEFLEDLWHNNSEKPVMSEHGMILVELNDITACKYSLWRSTTTYECLCNNKGYVHRWLYIDDLLPKKGGAE